MLARYSLELLFEKESPTLGIHLCHGACKVLQWLSTVNAPIRNKDRTLLDHSGERQKLA
jgi:hypothetical protein